MLPESEPEPAPGNATATTKRCRNCGADASGEFCAACGQETRVELPTARVFLHEAMGRYVALDGRLWRTLAALLFRPGFLTREYFQGRRRRYIRPARLFLVLSLAFFAAIRIFATAPLLIEDEPDATAGAKPAPTQSAKSAPKPVVKFDEGEAGGDIRVPGATIRVDRDLNLEILYLKTPWSLELRKRFEHFNGLGRQEKSEQVFLGAVRYGPYAAFMLMPAYALLLMVAYLGQGRRHPDRPRRYAEHLVFAAHTHAFVFLAGVLALSIPVNSVRAALGAWCVLHGLWAAKVVYRGGWMGLFARFMFVGLFYLMLFALLVLVLLLVAVLVR